MTTCSPATTSTGTGTEAAVMDVTMSCRPSYGVDTTCQAFVSPHSGRLTSQPTMIATDEEERPLTCWLVGGLNEMVEARALGTRTCEGRSLSSRTPARLCRREDRGTAFIREHNRVVAEDNRYVGSIVPIRDGVMTALRVE